MTRKDYEQFAAAFARVRGAMADRAFGFEAADTPEIIALNSIENELCAVMQSDNPRFNVDRFMSASHAQRETT